MAATIPLSICCGRDTLSAYCALWGGMRMNYEFHRSGQSLTVRTLNGGLAMRAFNVIFLTLMVMPLSACAFQRAQEASDAKVQMVGMTKPRVLACMGIPAQKAAEGKTEVWSYNSGDGHTSTFASGSAQTNVVGNAYGATGVTNSHSYGVTTSRYCVVNITMIDERVNSVAYVGPTGGLATQGEQCAFAIRNCLPQQR